MTSLDLATSAGKGALSLVLLAAPGYAQTYKETAMTQVATPPSTVAKDIAVRPFRQPPAGYSGRAGCHLRGGGVRGL